MSKNPHLNAWLDRPVFSVWPNFTVYHLIITLILATTVLSRFIMLGERVMSHDEVNHVVPAHSFYQGNGYRYDPVTHGPLQFHMIALSYTLFGDNDFSARIPDAVFGIAVVAFAIFAFKKYLGRIGALVAGFLFTISPFISYYSRYTRNEIYIVFWGMALIWGVLRYLEDGRKRSLLFITIITALHFTDKATSYIFTAELLIFLAILFIVKILTKTWDSPKMRSAFLIIVTVTMILGIAAFGFSYQALTNAPTSEDDEGIGVMFNDLDVVTRIEIGALGLGVIIGVGLAIFALIKGIGWQGIREERSFDLLIMQGTIVLPLLAALPMDILGFNPLDYSTNGMITSVLFIVPLFILALLIGLWWNWKVWILNIGIFWGIFTIFYTSLFTQGSGFPMGLMGALGYWMAQQGVTRGTQPLYYYALVQIPIYEFLPAFGTLLAALMSLPILGKAIKKASKPVNKNEDEEEIIPIDIEDAEDENIHEEIGIETTPEDEIVLTENTGLDAAISDKAVVEIASLNEGDADLSTENEDTEVLDIVDKEGQIEKPPVLGLLLYWSVMSLIAFSFAGERMPWLTTHIAMPMILTSGWSIGSLLESFDWVSFKKNRGWLMIIFGGIFLLTTVRTFGTLLSDTPPFQGRELVQLEATSTFMMAFLGMLVTGGVLAFLARRWTLGQMGKLLLLLFIGALSAITIRTSFRANFILYDTAKEFLVYAHAARDPKDALEQIEEISFRLTGGKDIVVAYDSDMLYPYWWYFRDYPNKRWYSGDPTRDLRDAPVILVGSGNYSKIEPVVADNYIRYDYTRLWWPTQDYYNLTFERVWSAFTNPEMRTALWEIWFNRNYEPYAMITNTDTFTLENWQPSDSFRMYIRKDVVSKIWEYGASPVTLEPTVDPYEEKTVQLEADQILVGNQDYQLNAPRDIAFAPDGSLYVADSRNHRILHLDQDGNLLHQWGEFAASDYNTNQMAPAGSFNEPWGLAVGQDGSVYVADTWNNRIQKFTAEGEFITMWGQFGTAETNFHFWGPRDVAIDSQGRVFITDTGNKRIVIFDSNGKDLASFGGAGLGVGQFDEPVGIALDDNNRIYVADTWNMRIQIMLPSGDSLSYPTHITWDVDAWTSESLDNKPFLAIDAAYNTYVADPIMGRVLIFDQTGNFLHAFGGFGNSASEIGLVGGIAFDPQGKLWVVDANYNRLMRFPISQLPLNDQTQSEENLGN